MSAGKHPLKKEDYTKAKEMIKAIEDDPNAEPFLHPVEWQELGLLDYPQIVKRPIDFATIKKNMGKGKYTTFDDLFVDIQLVWDNCKLYNMAGSEIYKLCEYMEKLSKRTIQKFRAQNNIQAAPLIVPSSRSLPVFLEEVARRLVIPRRNLRILRMMLGRSAEVKMKQELW